MFETFSAQEMGKSAFRYFKCHVFSRPVYAWEAVTWSTHNIIRPRQAYTTCRSHFTSRCIQEAFMEWKIFKFQMSLLIPWPYIFCDRYPNFGDDQTNINMFILMEFKGLLTRQAMKTYLRAVIVITYTCYRATRRGRREKRGTESLYFPLTVFHVVQMLKVRPPCSDRLV